MGAESTVTIEGDVAKYDQKTKALTLSVDDFIASLDSPERQAEAKELVKIFAAATGYPAKIYTGGMIGFGHYAYTYDSGHSGTAMATGFAPRKAELSLYGLRGEGTSALLARLGKHRQGQACVYAKRLSDLDHMVLSQLIVAGLTHLKSRYPVTPE